MKEDIVFTEQDFGFTFEDVADNELLDTQLEILQRSYEELQEENRKLQNTNREIMKQVTKLLNSLKREPDKEVIRWPNRVENIDNFLKELNNIYKNKE